jgi:hypothetical protein
MDESPEYIPMLNRTLIVVYQVTFRNTLRQSLMRSPFIVKLRIFSQHPFKMPFVENEQVIQTFFPDRAHPPLSQGIGIRCPVRGPQNRQAFRLKYRIKDLLPLMNFDNQIRSSQGRV